MGKNFLKGKVITATSKQPYGTPEILEHQFILTDNET